MTLVTCSSKTIDAYRLFSTFRKFHNDYIVWIIADKEPVTREYKAAVEKYFGNMEIYSTVVDEEYWAYRNCIYRPQWEDIYKCTRYLPPNEIIVRCDGTDVVFQKPIVMPEIQEGKVYLGYELWRYKDTGTPQHGWWIKQYQNKYAESRIKNSGFVIAKAKTFNRIAKDMAHADINGVYADQNLFQVVIDKNNIEAVDCPDITMAIIISTLDKRDNGLWYADGIAPSALHCNSAKTNERVKTVLIDIVPENAIEQIDKHIQGAKL